MAFFCPGSPVSLPSNSSEAKIYRCVFKFSEVIDAAYLAAKSMFLSSLEAFLLELQDAQSTNPTK